MRLRNAALTALLLCSAGGAGMGERTDTEMRTLNNWPKPTRDNRPWTRWWWLGSAVDRPNLTAQLEQLGRAGFGGVEICPIYGAKGFENRYIPFLSPRWVDMLAHATGEASRLGMGVDLTTGTGWPFGGPGVTREEASSRIEMKRYEVEGGAALAERLPEGGLQTLMAVSDTGERVELSERVRGRRLEWTAPPGQWKLYAIVQVGPVQKVKRAAPGGEGNVVDPYSVRALEKYLSGFSNAFSGFQGVKPRAHFHDSFEYYNATWTPDFLAEFQKRRGYDLRMQLPALFGDGPSETVAHVKSDYRETISDLHLDYLTHWSQWAHARGGLSRNQAHGVPGTLLDHYAAVDIPETESFRDVDGKWVPMFKFASSAANLTGQRLVSAESFTWLGEHFQTSLADLKPAADLLFLSGINHLIYHGVPYSPEDAGWPGWLFYASVHFGPNGGLWRDLPAFNAYVTRVQSILQSGKPDNDILLYFPIHDLWRKTDGLVTQLSIAGKWMEGTPFFTAAMHLWYTGYGFDHVSDRLLASATVENGRVAIGDGRYSAILIPKVNTMPSGTFRKLREIAAAGVKILFWGPLPSDVPGLADREGRLSDFAHTRRSFDRLVKSGGGTALAADDLISIITRPNVRRERMANDKLQFVRRRRESGYDYFVVNTGPQAFDGWVPLSVPVRWAVLLDPRFADRVGRAELQRQKDGANRVRLHLQPGESIVLRTFTASQEKGKQWAYSAPAGESRPIAGPWQVKFFEGGPVLPPPFQTSSLDSWTEPSEETRRFSGTARYTVTFDHPSVKADDWLLTLGFVCETARVKLNGREVSTLWSRPFQVSIGKHLKSGRNLLEVEVTNLAANRIADLDRRAVAWKRFHEINFVNREYTPFDASKWPTRASGLLGPVRLIPMRNR